MQQYAKQEQAAPSSLNQQSPLDEEYETGSPNIIRDKDGAYHWFYEMNLWRNHHLLDFLMKAILIPSGFVFAFLLVISSRSGATLSHLAGALPILGGVLLLIVVIILFCYAVIAKISHGVACMVYKMNDTEILFSQAFGPDVKDYQSERLAALAEEAAKSSVPLPSAPPAPSNLANASEFRSVKTVTIDRDNHVICLNSWFLYNMIYCREEDFEFVMNYITRRCINAWIRVK